MRSIKSLSERFSIINVALGFRLASEAYATAIDSLIRQTVTHSTPFSVRALALGFDGSLVIPRILNSSAALGSPRTDLITEPPWTPVAPKTTRIFFADIVGKAEFLDIGMCSAEQWRSPKSTGGWQLASWWAKAHVYRDAGGGALAGLTALWRLKLKVGTFHQAAKQSHSASGPEVLRSRRALAERKS